LNKLTFILFYLFSLPALAQQLTHYTQQPFLQLLINPAFAGNAKCTEMKSVHRAQWVGIDGAPQSTALAVTGRFGKQSEDLAVFHGFALKFENDRIGPFQHNRLHGAYAIHFPIKKEHFLSFGTYFGMDNINFDNSSLSPLYTDLAVQSSRFSFLAPDFSFGSKYNTKTLFFGITFQNMIPLRYPIGSQSRKVFHTNLSTGGQYKLGSSEWSISPMLNLRFAAKTPLALDVYSIFDFKQQVFMGVGFRNQESVQFLARFLVLSFFKVGYSFDWIYNRLGGGMGHTHEISLSITSCKARKTGTTICPVFD
jgi:type IX secretion system PorP/SprF family membrane protein